MTRERAKELLPVIEAFANGAEVQVHRIGDVWLTLTEPTFVDDAVYRIKPKPLEVWLTVTGDSYGDVRGLSRSEAEAREFARGYENARIVRMVEVVE